MTLRLRPLLFILASVAFGVLALVFHPKAEEVEDESTPSKVSEADVQTYIKIYSAMQDDHDLKIDDAIRPYNLSLEAFRHTERRIQEEARLVERVREALLDHAKKRALFARAGDMETPVSTATATRRVAPKKKTPDAKK